VKKFTFALRPKRFLIPSRSRCLKAPHGLPIGVGGVEQRVGWGRSWGVGGGGMVGGGGGGGRGGGGGSSNRLSARDPHGVFNCHGRPRTRRNPTPRPPSAARSLIHLPHSLQCGLLRANFLTSSAFFLSLTSALFLQSAAARATDLPFPRDLQ